MEKHSCAFEIGEVTTYKHMSRGKRHFMFIHSCEFISMPLKIHLLNIESLSTESHVEAFVGIGFTEVFGFFHALEQSILSEDSCFFAVPLASVVLFLWHGRAFF